MADADLQEIIQRLQNLSDLDFNEEDINAFVATCQKCLEEERVAFLLQIIQDEKNKVIIGNMGWNLVGPITRCLQKCSAESEKGQFCLQMINDLIQLCNPKEVLLGLLEHIDEATEQIAEIILLLLEPLQKVLLKLGKKNAYSVGLSLSTIRSQLCRLPVPYTKEQIEADEYAFCRCCSALVQFAKPFVEFVAQNTDVSKEPEAEELRKELVTFCYSCLKQPLLNAPLNPLCDDIDDNPFRLFAKELLRYLVSLGESLPKAFVQLGNVTEAFESKDLEEGKYEPFACLAYLLFVQHIGMDDFPCVFGPLFLLKANMEHVDVLIKRTEESVLSKGLELLESSLLRAENESLHQDLLEVKAVLQVVQGLVKVMTLCPIEQLRKKSLQMLQLLIDKFVAEGKYMLFRCLLKTSNHAGVEGYIIQNIKNQIDFALKTGRNTCFARPRLTPLLHMVLSLPERAETDLLQNSDRIMASLNLLRYLLIKDETDNETGVWAELPKIEQDYLKPLHMGLNMSRAHYEAEMKNTNEKRKGAHSKKSVCTVTVGGETLPDMTPEMQLQVLQSALFTFDLMESVLARVEELIEAKLRSASEEKIGSSKDV
ncbi:glomulin [Spea bombifrons]|uniref:glomulin n=1 Tax=Spea bombifrons TaxID=233779 RepID=UPI00234B0E77|nr:glomulin [Spea bombifrons]